MATCWSILAHRMSTGAFSGMALTCTLLGMPALRNTSDPLPAWKKFYEGGKNFSIVTTLITVGTGIYSYTQTKNKIFLVSAGLQFLVMPFTIFVMLPGIKRLYKLDKKQDAEIRSEMEAWHQLHHLRTFLGFAAFATVLLSDQKCLSNLKCTKSV